MTQSGSYQRSEQNAENSSADKKLDQHFGELKAENYSGSFEEVENWLYRKAIEMNSEKIPVKERKLSGLRNFFFASKQRLAYTIVALLVLVGACNMPVTQTESAGQMITLTVAKADLPGFSEKLNELPWIKNSQVRQNENVNNGEEQVLFTIVLPNTTEEQVKEYAKEVESIGNISTIRIMPMDYDVKRPLYSAALDRFFSIKIDATGMSDEELQAEVERKLHEQGVDMFIRFKTSPEGTREVIQMELHGNGNENQNSEPKQYEINIDDKDGREKIKLMQKKGDPNQFKGKTDSEIRQMIREESGNKDLKDEQIKITRDGEKIQVKVENDVKIKEPAK
jgi:hypothetical protein